MTSLQKYKRPSDVLDRAMSTALAAPGPSAALDDTTEFLETLPEDHDLFKDMDPAPRMDVNQASEQKPESPDFYLGATQILEEGDNTPEEPGPAEPGPAEPTPVQPTQTSDLPTNHYHYYYGHTYNIQWTQCTRCSPAPI